MPTHLGVAPVCTGAAPKGATLMRPGVVLLSMAPMNSGRGTEWRDTDASWRGTGGCGTNALCYGTIHGRGINSSGLGRVTLHHSE